MIYANNNGIIPMNEGLIDMIKKAFCKKVHKKPNTKPITKSKNNKSSSSPFTSEEWDIINDNANKFFKEHWNAITNIAKKIISETDIENAKKGFEFKQYSPEDIWAFVEDKDYNTEFKGKLPVMISSPLVYIDLWDAEPKARTEFDGPVTQEVWELSYKIQSAIDDYGRDNDIKLYGYIDGDWDTFSIFLFTSCKYLLQKDNKETNSVNESCIFKYANLL